MAVVLFDNKMSFNNAKNPIDIVLVEHLLQGCIELIAFDSVLQIEAPRIYVNLSLLKIKFNNSLFESAKINSNGDTKTLNIVQFITSRIIVSAMSDGTQLVVNLTPITDFDVIADKTTNRIDIVHATIPVSIVPYKTERELSRCLSPIDDLNETAKLSHTTISDNRRNDIISSLSGLPVSAVAVNEEGQSVGTVVPLINKTNVQVKMSSDALSIFSPRPEREINKTVSCESFPSQLVELKKISGVNKLQIMSDADQILISSSLRVDGMLSNTTTTTEDISQQQQGSPSSVIQSTCSQSLDSKSGVTFNSSDVEYAEQCKKSHAMRKVDRVQRLSLDSSPLPPLRHVQVPAIRLQEISQIARPKGRRGSLIRPIASRSEPTSLNNSADEAEGDTLLVRRTRSRDAFLKDNSKSRSETPYIDSIGRRMSQFGGVLTASGDRSLMELSQMLVLNGANGSSGSSGSSGVTTGDNSGGSSEPMTAYNSQKHMGIAPPGSPLVSDVNRLRLAPLNSLPNSPFRSRQQVNSGEDNVDSCEVVMAYVTNALSKSHAAQQTPFYDNSLPQSNTPPVSRSTSSSVTPTCLNSPRPGSVDSPRPSQSQSPGPHSLPSLGYHSPSGYASPCRQGSFFTLAEGIASPHYRCEDGSPNKTSVFQYNNFVETVGEYGVTTEKGTKLTNSSEGCGYMNNYNDSCKYSTNWKDENDADDDDDDESLFYLDCAEEIVTPRRESTSTPCAVATATRTLPLGSSGSSKFHSCRGLPPRVTSSTPPPNMYAI